MPLALVLTSIVLSASAVTREAEDSSECPYSIPDSAEHKPSCSDEKKPSCPHEGLLTENSHEGLSLVQVGARRIQREAAAKQAAQTSSLPATAADKLMPKASGTVDATKSSSPAAAAIHTSPLHPPLSFTAADKPSPAVGAATESNSPAEVLMTLATSVKAHVSTMGQAGVQALANARTRSSYTLSIVIVVVVGLVALALLAMALQPGASTRGGPPGNISQNFPQRTTGPYGRQGPSGYQNPDSYNKVPGYAPYGSGFAPAPDRPSFRDSYMPPPRLTHNQGQAPSEPDSLRGSAADVSQGRSLPRVSTPAGFGSGYGSGYSAGGYGVSGSKSQLPRVQGPKLSSGLGSRPGTGLDLTPANTGNIMPMKDAAAEYPDNAMLPALPSATQMRPPEITGCAPRRPPALCPMLVLPHCESFFAVPIDQLVAGMNTVEILGLSGNALLRSTQKDSDGGRVIEVSMSPPRSPPLASISAPQSYGPRAGLRELKGSRGKHYGWLRPSGNGYVLQCGEDDVMTVITNPSLGQCQLYAGSNGDMLAQASRSGDGERIFDDQDLEVRVTPGMDAVLALLCVLSSALFKDGATPFSFPPARPSGLG